jgi:predicted Zn-dependent peptidase
VQASGFTEEELDGYKVRTRAQKISEAEANSSLALQLAQAQIFYGDWHQWFRETERAQALTLGDLKGAMERTLVKSNRTIGMIVNARPESSVGGGR